MPTVDVDERDLVEAVSRFGAVRLVYTRLRPRDVAEVEYRDVAVRPRATLNFEVATSRHAVDAGVRTILSGWGGDEAIAFNGRGYFADLARHGRLGTIHRELRLRSRIHGGSLAGAWKSRVLTPLLPDRALLRGRGNRRRSRPSCARTSLVFSPMSSRCTTPSRGSVQAFVGCRSSLLEFGHLQYRMESWASHGAALGLTYAFPLLDRRITEFALSLPPRMFFRDGWKRWLYRTAMAGILPEVVRWNPKKFDNAAAQQLRSVLLEPAEVVPSATARAIRQPARRRRRPPRRAGSPAATAVRCRRPSSPSPSLPIGRGAWLAFTRLQPA